MDTVAEARRRAGLPPTASVELRYPPTFAPSPLSRLTAELRTELQGVLRELIPIPMLSAAETPPDNDQQTEDLLSQISLLLQPGQLLMPERLLIY
jgi:hypothetical protein